MLVYDVYTSECTKRTLTAVKMHAVATRRPPDPEARREAILAAAEELIAEIGTERVSHRAIAERAGVSLGSTTYYFPTRGDIVDAALARTAKAFDAWVDEWAETFASADDLGDAIADLMHDYLHDASGMLPETEAYYLGTRDPGLQPLAQKWIADFGELLARYVDRETADMISAFLDGAGLQAAINRAPPSREFLRKGVRRLMQNRDV